MNCSIQRSSNLINDSLIILALVRVLEQGVAAHHQVLLLTKTKMAEKLHRPCMQVYFALLSSVIYPPLHIKLIDIVEAERSGSRCTSLIPLVISR